MAQYLSSTKQDKATSHHKFLESVAAYIEKMNEGRKRVRDVSSVRNPETLTLTHSAGRDLIDRTKQAVLLSDWAKAFPGQPLPPAEQQGVELWQGKPVKVAYVPRDGSKAYHLDLEAREGTATVHQTQVANLEDDGAQYEQEALESKKFKMLEHHAQKMADVQKLASSSTAGPAGSAGPAEEKAESSSSDASSASPRSDHDFLKVIDPFGLSSAKPSKAAAKTTPKVWVIDSE